MALAHLRSAATLTRALTCRASGSAAPRTRFAPRASARRAAMSACRASAVSPDAEDAQADAGAGGAGSGMMWCGRCAGEGVLVSLTKAQKRARRAADARERPRDDMAPRKALPCKACRGVGLVATEDGEPLRRATARRASPSWARASAAPRSRSRCSSAACAWRSSTRTRASRAASRATGSPCRSTGGPALGALGLTLEGVGSDANVSLDARGRELGRYGHSTRPRARGGRARAAGGRGEQRRGQERALAEAGAAPRAPGAARAGHRRLGRQARWLRRDAPRRERARVFGDVFEREIERGVLLRRR